MPASPTFLGHKSPSQPYDNVRHSYIIAQEIKGQELGKRSLDYVAEVSEACETYFKS